MSSVMCHYNQAYNERIHAISFGAVREIELIDQYIASEGIEYFKNLFNVMAERNELLAMLINVSIEAHKNIFDSTLETLRNLVKIIYSSVLDNPISNLVPKESRQRLYSATKELGRAIYQLDLATNIKIQEVFEGRTSCA